MVSSDIAVIGPPWETMPASAARLLMSSDPPVIVAPDAWAVAAVRPGRLRRCRGPKTAAVSASIMAAAGDGTALVLRGAVQLSSGRWLWPVVADRVEVDKALNPRDPRDFNTLVAVARDRLVTAATVAENSALHAMVPSISAANWAALDVATANAVIDEIEAGIIGIAADPRFESAFVGLGAETQATAAAAARSTVIRGSRGSLSRADRELANRIGSRRGGVFLTDEYGRRATQYEARAAAIIGDAAGTGASSHAIGQELSSTLGSSVSGRSAWYFQVVANAAMGSARSYGELASMRDAGLRSYTWVSVLDERTSDICDFLDGSVFPVQDSLDRFARADAASPEGAIDEFPWYSVVGGAIMTGPRGAPAEDRTTVATIATPRTDDSRGSYSTVTPPVLAGGTPTPPAHGNCRSLLQPEF